MFKLEGIKFKDILNIEKLSIPENKVTCIVGESGSGKTTLLKILNKLISPDEGSIYYLGDNVISIDSVALRREVLMLPQNPAIFSGSVRDNLQLGLKFSEKPLALDEDLNSILELVRLKKSLDDDAEKLSGGEKQRLALGRVLLMDPKIFLLDEPSSALDEDTEKFIIEGIVNFSRKNNKTLIMVTHSKRVAESYSDIIIEVKNGRIASQREV